MLVGEFCFPMQFYTSISNINLKSLGIDIHDRRLGQFDR